jgi:nitrogen fixation NifU-like protein
MMTEQVKGKSRSDALALFESVHRLLTEEFPDVDPEQLGRLTIFSGVRNYPSRVKCASLAWHTLRVGLETDGRQSVTTE